MTEEVLLLDDDATMLSILDGILSGSGYSCITATSATEALALVKSRPQIAVVLSDILMPDMTGLQFVDRLNALTLNRTRPRVLLLTGQPTLEAAVDALRLGVRDFLVKPIRAPDLIDAVRRAMAQLHGDVATQEGRSPQLDLLLRQAEELAGRLRTLAYSPPPPPAPRAPDSPPPSRTESPEPLPARELKPEPTPSEPSDTGKLAILDTIEHLRRLRSRYEHHNLDDVAWDLLLELLRAERLQQRLSVSGLAISISGVSATTSLRRVNELSARGYMERIPDPADARRDFVMLTSQSHALLSDYLTQANTYLSALN